MWSSWTTRQRKATALSSSSPPASARAASACAPPARVAQNAGDPTARARVHREARHSRRSVIRSFADHTPRAVRRKDRARRPRRELASTVLDGARECGPTDGEPDDDLMISAGAAASTRLGPTGRPRARRACASPAPARRRGREGPRAARGGRGRGRRDPDRRAAADSGHRCWLVGWLVGWLVKSTMEILRPNCNRSVGASRLPASRRPPSPCRDDQA